MAGGGSSGLSPLVQSQKVASGSEAFFLSWSNRFAGERGMLSFEDIRGGGAKSGGSFYRSFEAMEEDDLNDYLLQPEKKKRLTADQVQFLEKGFKLENKLEPERKVQLAKDLGLQPRQIAIWFQNRRARWKTKQLEKDYDTLHASYNALKANYDVLVKESDQLKDQVRDLTDMLQLEGKQGENFDLSRKLSEGLVQIPIAESVSEEEASNIPNPLSNKHEEICSAQSNILDSDSPRYADCGHFSLLEPGDSSYMFEPDQSNISQEEEGNLSESLIPTQILFPMLKNNHFTDPPATNAYSFEFSADDPAFWS